MANEYDNAAEIQALKKQLSQMRAILNGMGQRIDENTDAVRKAVDLATNSAPVLWAASLQATQKAVDELVRLGQKQSQILLGMGDAIDEGETARDELKAQSAELRKQLALLGAQLDAMPVPLVDESGAVQWVADHG